MKETTKITVELTDDEITRLIYALKIRANGLQMKYVEDTDETEKMIHKELYEQVRAIEAKFRAAINC